MITDVKEFTVKRSEWLRGEGDDDSYLYRTTDSKKCCVGFFALACGLEQRQIENIVSMAELNKVIGSVYNGRFVTKTSPTTWTTSFSAAKIYAINDSEILTDQEREATLINYFQELDIKINFID